MHVLCIEFKEHYHLERPHQGLDNDLIVKPSGKKSKIRTRAPDTIRLRNI